MENIKDSEKLDSPVTLFAAIEESQYEALRVRAFEERRPIGSVVREVLDLYLKDQATKAPEEGATTKTLVILRGCSGSGKSSYATKHFPTAPVCSADHFFMQKGKYRFNPKLLGVAHGASKIKCGKLLKDGKPLVVVDNTHTRLSEMKPYLDLAEHHDYEVKVIRIICDPVVAAGRTIHKTPPEIVLKQSARFEDYPSETTVSTG